MWREGPSECKALCCASLKGDERRCRQLTVGQPVFPFFLQNKRRTRRGHWCSVVDYSSSSSSLGISLRHVGQTVIKPHRHRQTVGEWMQCMWLLETFTHSVVIFLFFLFFTINLLRVAVQLQCRADASLALHCCCCYYFAGN